jgi:hypothetical protein
MSSKPVLRIDWATHEAAKYACLNWHYSKSLPVGKTVKVGAWENMRFIGVVIFAYGANNNIGKPYGLQQVECCELVRVALADHKTAVSKIVAIALKFLKKNSPGVRLVVSYADTAQGHYGGIYQAGNWVFSGTSKGATQYVLNGRIVHSMQVQTYIRAGKLKSRAGLEKASAGDKHKYLMPLDDAMRAKIAPLAKPYPKSTRVKKQDAGHPPALGGAVPTDTLQSISLNKEVNL